MVHVTGCVTKQSATKHQSSAVTPNYDCRVCWQVAWFINKYMNPIWNMKYFQTKYSIFRSTTWRELARWEARFVHIYIYLYIQNKRNCQLRSFDLSNVLICDIVFPIVSNTRPTVATSYHEEKTLDEISWNNKFWLVHLIRFNSVKKILICIIGH